MWELHANGGPSAADDGRGKTVFIARLDADQRSDTVGNAERLGSVTFGRNEVARLGGVVVAPIAKQKRRQLHHFTLLAFLAALFLSVQRLTNDSCSVHGHFASGAGGGGTESDIIAVHSAATYCTLRRRRRYRVSALVPTRCWAPSEGGGVYALSCGGVR